MADEPQKVIVQNNRIDASILPPGFSLPYRLYVIQQTTDLQNIANASNNANDLAYQATIKNEEQDVTLSDHETRITQNTTNISALTVRMVTAEGKITNLETQVATLMTRVTTTEGNITILQGSVSTLQSQIANHETRISLLEYATTRKKSEVIYSGVSLVIPTTASNLITLIKALTPTSGTLTPFFDTTSDKMVVYNENKTLSFKLSLIGSWPGGTSNRSIQLTFSGSVPDVIVNSRNAATSTDNILMTTFFSVDKDGFLATNGSTLTIQSNGAAFTATTIKIIAEQ